MHWQLEENPGRIIGIDIETRPTLAYVWGQYDQDIYLEQIVEPGGMTCFASLAFGSGKKAEFRSEYHDGFGQTVRRAWEILDAAEVVVHYNGKRFDVRHLQTEFAKLKLGPTSPFKQIDLLEVVKRNFKFFSNKLAFVAPQLGLEDKVEHEGFRLWKDCMAGDPKAWRKMKSYNIQDTKLLEDAYNAVREWL